ncbi:Serine/threonine-protein kinase pkn1 [termite gut metagenome]|uniref:Serine/threonine-protein kinase pkn1 n=1 Tax=termite gut metagenome TaxID=433724 RepID=A0A5J4S691_9ZZZZ
MILIRILGGWLIGAILLIGCTSEDEQEISGDNLVRFNSQLVNISSVSRSSDVSGPTVLTKENWMLGDAIGIYMKYNDSKPFSKENIIVNNYRYLSTKDKVSTSIFVPATEEDKIYYPNLGSDFISYYPYESTIGKECLYPIDVSQQSDPSKIDLLYATSNAGSSEKGDVSLSFKHQLSKLVLNLKPDLAIPELSDAWATLVVMASGFYTKANFSLIDKVISDRSEIRDVSIAKTPDGMRVEMILIPQTVERNMCLKFGLSGNKNELRWNIPEGKVFEAGKQYEYTVSVKMTWIEVFEGEILPWGGGSKFDDIVWGKSSDTQYGLTKITGGDYYIGSPEGVGEENEYPRHKVAVGGGWISSYEITNKQYVEFLNKVRGVSFNGIKDGLLLMDVKDDAMKIEYIFDNDTWKVVDPSWDNYPVVNVTWYGARMFAQWLGGDLPTEAEWETACRAGNDGLFSFENSNEEINYNDFVNCEQTSAAINGVSGGIVPVNYLRPNASNLYNMHGNVYEWCLDIVRRSAMGSPAPYDYRPTVSDEKYRSIRGGSWKTDLNKCRSAVRISYLPDHTADDIGFRVVFPISNVANLNFGELEEFLKVSPLP